MYLYQPFKSFKPFKTIEIGKTDSTLHLFVNTKLLVGFSIASLRAIALTPLNKKISFTRHFHVFGIPKMRKYHYRVRQFELVSSISLAHAHEGDRNPTRLSPFGEYPLRVVC